MRQCVEGTLASLPEVTLDEDVSVPEESVPVNHRKPSGSQVKLARLAVGALCAVLVLSPMLLLITGAPPPRQETRDKTITTVPASSG